MKSHRKVKKTKKTPRKSPVRAKKTSRKSPVRVKKMTRKIPDRAPQNTSESPTFKSSSMTPTILSSTSPSPTRTSREPPLNPSPPSSPPPNPETAKSTPYSNSRTEPQSRNIYIPVMRGNINIDDGGINYIDENGENKYVYF
uniref:Uncharacterized protein n=1 Tax=viral metagenome TaxID=1070528 RepID=A0A6C0KCU0_9ZZZZ